MTKQEMRFIRRETIAIFLRRKFTLSGIKWWTRQTEYEDYGEELKAYEYE